MNPRLESAGIRDDVPEVDMEGPTRIELPEIDNASALLADETITLPPEIIKDVLHQGLKGVLGSGSKARKTWILLDAGISVASGTRFWKWETRKGRVLYINFEIPRAFIRSRIRRLCERKGVTDVSNLDVWTLRGHGTALWKLLPSLLAKVEAGKYALIIIDPIYKGLGGRDENSAGDISELCNELERMAEATGAAVLFAAHFSKGNQAGKEAIDRIGGSGVWGRDPDVIITLTKHNAEGAYTVDLTLRNLPEQPPFVVEWDFPFMKEAPHLQPDDLKQPAGNKRKEKRLPTEDEFLSLFRSDPNQPRACLISAVELRHEFRRREWDEAAAPALRDKYEACGKVEIFHGAHNAKLAGLPAMVEAFRQQQNEAGTVLEQVPLPVKPNARAKAKKRRK